MRGYFEVKGDTWMNVPVGQVAHEESADGRDDQLGQPYRDEDGVAAAEVEPVATQQAQPKAGMTKLKEARFSSQVKYVPD